MWILAVIAILFGVAQIFQIATGQAEPLNVILGFGISAIAGWSFFFFRSESDKRESLLAALFEERSRIEEDGATINDVLITPDTELESFTAIVSFVIVTARLESRFYFPDDPNRGSTRARYLVATVLFGWWAIPWGPIDTLRVLLSRGGGAKRIRVKDLIDESDAEYRSDSLVEAARFEKRGDWEEAIEIYQHVIAIGGENTEYAKSCIQRIREKQQAARG